MNNIQKSTKNIKVAAALIVRNSKILIARRKNHISNGGQWEFPGGKIKKHESANETIIREMQEEFGLIVYPKLIIGSIKSFLENNIQIQLVGVVCDSEDKISFLKDHQAIEWCGFYDIKNYNLSEPDIKFINSYAKEIKNLMKVEKIG